MALAHRYRLPKKDIEMILADGRTFRGTLLFFKCKHNDRGLSRFAVVVSKKVSLKAVDRNLVKRRIQAAIIATQKQHEIFFKNHGIDCVAIALPAIVGKAYKEIKTEIDQIIDKISVYR